jgi:hemerythrin-like domain-containing protein
MKIVENLRAEHQKILSTLRAVSQLARQMEKGGPLKVDPIRAMVASTLEFQSRCHHFKEERLFQILGLRLGAEGLPLLAELEAEHKASSELLKNIERQLAQTLPQVPFLKSRIVETLWTFVELNCRHIDKEEKWFFPLAERLIPPDEELSLWEYFKPSSPLPPAGPLPSTFGYKKL